VAKALVKRHYVTIKRPSTAKGTKGQRTGSDTIVLANWPCSIETLSGGERELARTIVVDATHRVIGWADRTNPIRELDYLVLEGGRRLAIGHVADPEQLGLEWHLLCAEDR